MDNEKIIQDNDNSITVKYPICPINMYFEGDEDKCDTKKCDWNTESRSCNKRCEIKMDKKADYKYLIIFVAVSNDTYDEWDRTILLRKCPKNYDKVKKLVQNTYDGVWCPQLDTIQIFQLVKKLL